MQDRYSGDVGDFLKLGLLRWLTAADDEHPGLSLGMLWYLTADESHNDDGKHTGYLDPTTRLGRSLERLDPELHRRLATMVQIERSVWGRLDDDLGRACSKQIAAVLSSIGA